MTNVAIFTTYSPSEGFGGPARTFHQRRILEAAGHEVTHVVVHASGGRGDCRPTDLVVTSVRPRKERIDHIYADVDLGRRAARDRALVSTVSSHLAERSVDLVILEQPFLVDLVEATTAERPVPVIYSCQNIEYRLRRDLERFQFDPKRPIDRSEEVRALEERSIELSVAVTAICPTDQELLVDEFGCDSVLVPNGTSVCELPLPTKGASSRDPFFSFAGSSYWPNIEGFAEIATPSLAFLPPTVKVHVAGSVGAEILRDRSIIRHQSANASRIVQRGFLPMDELVEMMHRSCAVLVPVFVGEGSNLKSADALASGSPVIMTERATRGYERVIEEDPEGVTVVRSADEFRHRMLDRINHGAPAEVVGTTRRQMLTWSSRAAPLIEVVERAAGSGRAL